jgi:hypothetical protein
MLDPVIYEYKLEHFFDLHKTTTVRCCEFVVHRQRFMPHKADKLYPVVPSEEKSSPFKEWVGYKYCTPHNTFDLRRLFPEGVPSQLLAPEVICETEKNIRIEKWAQSLPVDKIVELKDLEDAEYPSHPEQKIRGRRVLEFSTNNIDRPALVTNTSVVTTPAQVGGRPSSTQDLSDGNCWIDGGSIILKDVKKSVISESNHATTQKHEFKKSHGQESLLAQVAKTQTQHTGLCKPTYSAALSGPATGVEIEKISAAPAVPFQPEGDQAIKELDTFFNAPYGQEKTLLCDDIEYVPYAVLEPSKVARPSPKVVLQTRDEVSSRVYHNTMNQQKPRVGKGGIRSRINSSSPKAPSVSRSTPTPEMVVEPPQALLDQVTQGLLSVLQLARGYNGRVSLKAEIGRFLISRVHERLIGSEDLPKSCSIDAMSKFLGQPKVFTKADGKPYVYPLVEFTSLITTTPAEMQYIVDLRYSNGDRMWHTAADRSVSYEIACGDLKTSAGFNLEVDGENFTTTARNFDEILGNVDVHCTLRNWDYRIIARGSKPCGGFDGFAKQVVGTLYVP